jgi:hypothetical protein
LIDTLGDALYSPVNSAGVYDTRVAGEKERLARDLWAGDFAASMAELRANNAELVAVLRAQISNQSDVTAHSVTATERHIDGVLLDTVRAQNMFKVPLITAATSLICEVNKTSREYHDFVSRYHMGAAMSERWVTEFLPVANACRPTASEDMIPGVMCTCFDNLSMKIDYSAYSTEGETGRLLDMTNWFSTRLPRHLAPNFDAQAACAPPCARRRSPALPRSARAARCHVLSYVVVFWVAVRDGIFCRLSLRSFGLLFYSDHPEIVSNKNRRWVRFLQAARNGVLLDRPNVSVFNEHRFYFIHVQTRACAEYINFIAATPGAESLDDPEGFLAKASANIDFEWVCRFEYDAGFFVLDFLQSVRGAKSKILDLLWREFFASAQHSGTANKTQYVPMAIMRVFWGMALTPELSKLYHKIRTRGGSWGVDRGDAERGVGARQRARREDTVRVHASSNNVDLCDCVPRRTK